MLLELSTLFLNVRDVLDLLGVALSGLGHFAHRLLKRLHGVIEIPLTTIRDVLHHIKLLLQVSDFFVCRFALFKLLILHLEIDLFENEHFGGELIALTLHHLHCIDKLVTVFLQLPNNVLFIIHDT